MTKVANYQPLLPSPMREVTDTTTTDQELHTPYAGTQLARSGMELVLGQPTVSTL